MTISIQLKIVEAAHFSKAATEYFEVKVRAFDFMPYLQGNQWMEILVPNVRRPAKNHVTTSIVNSIRESISRKEAFEIPNPIAVSVLKYRTSGTILNLTLAEVGDNGRKLGDGVLDGGHRLLALRTAFFENTTSLDNVYLTLRIYQNLTDEQIRTLAIALNTSGKVTESTIRNYQGQYDWVKPYLEKYPYIRFYDNEPNTYDDIYCSVERVFTLLLLLDSNYRISSLDLSKRHPINVARTGISSNKRMPRIKELSYLIQDVLFLQNEISEQIDSLSITKTIKYVKQPKTIKQCTHLPDGKILKCKLPSRMYVFPILSAFRMLLDENGYWKIDLRKLALGLIRKMIKRYQEILAMQRFQERTSESIVVDMFVWDEMCKVIVTTYPIPIRIAS
ncbi:hypothetical protein [Scytonema sp. NUACC26]|uniref:hypothetical protein n=1 Tax=Scytonema sp. NUACC26 TaxID=3140176 RepID=UPI0034DC3EE6